MVVNRCFKEVSRGFQDSFKGVSMKIEGCFKGAFTDFPEYFEEVQRVKSVSSTFQGCFKVVSRMFHESLEVLKSFMLRGIHRSNLSRRRVCFISK